MCKVLIEYIMHLLHIFMINVDNPYIWKSRKSTCLMEWRLPLLIDFADKKLVIQVLQYIPVIAISIDQLNLHSVFCF